MTDWGPDDAELVLAAAGGDDVAVSRLVDRWLPVALRWCNRLCGPKVDPEDAAHDSIMIVLRRLPDLRDPDAFPSWLYGIVRRTIAGHRRKAWVRRWVPGVAPEDRPDEGPSPAQQRHLSEVSQQVQAVLEMLPPKQREVLVLCDVEDLTDEEAAELLDIPVGTAKSRLRTARQRFEALARKRRLDEAVADDVSTG